MQRIVPILVCAALALAGCEARQETPTTESHSAAQQPAAETEVPASAIRVSYRMTVQGTVKGGIEGRIGESLDAAEKLAVVAKDPDWELRLIARDSAGQDIYCDSLVTLSALFLQPDEAGGYRIRDHRAATVPSEDTEDVVMEIVKDFKDLVLNEAG